jgi:hypothetical protein
MERRTATRPLCRAPGLILIAVCVLLLTPAVALGVDGVPLYPPGIDAGYAWTSMENPDMSGPMLAFELFGLSGSPVVKSQTATVYGWNAATGHNRPIGLDGSPPAGADQRHPSVIDVGVGGGVRDVYVVWQQWNDPVTATRDIWLWRGDEQGNPDAGFPMLLIEGPANSNQYAPELGLAQTPSGGHLIVTWADDRDTAGATTEVYMLDLTANNYLKPGYNPKHAGDRVDPSGDSLKGQHDPVVGAKGIFWLDERDAQAAGNADVYRANLASVAPEISKFWTNPTDYEVRSPRATGEGVAWLGPGIAGGPFEPWVKRPDGGSGIITTLSAPFALDVYRMRFAVTGGHGGNTSGDDDIFVYDKATGQNVPVCSVGSDDGDKLKIQDMPTISSAPGGSRVVWADARQHTNTAATDWDSLAYELYVALVPTVSVSPARKTLHLGQSVTLGTRVSPNFAGYKVKFQEGTRQTLKHAWYLGGKQVWYSGWSLLKGEKLSKKSTASWTWTPTKKGTYWVRAWFVGGKKYVDVQNAHRKVPHVPNTSKVIKIVVK